LFIKLTKTDKQGRSHTLEVHWITL